MVRLVLAWCIACVLGCSEGRPVAALDGAPDLGAGLVPLDAASAGYALSFDGVRSYATAGNGGFPTVGENLTIELWVRFAASSATEDFLAFRRDLRSGVQLGLHAGALAVWRVYVDRVLVQAPANPAPDTWHHVAYVRDKGTNVLYLDGVAVATSTSPADNHTPSSAWLGTLDGSRNMFEGQMDEVRIWSVARPPEGIVADMQRRTAPGESGLIALWTFDDAGSGGRSLDLSGRGNEVTLGDGVAAYMPARVPSELPVQ